MKRPIVLDVRDLRSQQPLRGITVHAAHVLWKQGGWGHPRDPEKCIGAGDSPLTLTRPFMPNEYLPIVVEAPGHAPQLLELVEPLADVTVVALAPPGTLEIEVSEIPADAPTELRLIWLEARHPLDSRRAVVPALSDELGARRAREAESLTRGADPTKPFDLDYAKLLRRLSVFQTWPRREAGRFRVEGLPHGRWGVLLRSTFDDVVFDVGTASFRLEPEATARVAIRGRTEVGLPRIGVAGTITIDPAWTLETEKAPLVARLECASIDPATGAAAKPRDREAALAPLDAGGRTRFEFGSCWPGTYVVHLDRIAASRTIEVAAGAPAAHDFSIAAPADVELTVHLEGSAAPFDRARVDWAPDGSARGLAVFFDPKEGLAPELESGRFRFRAPAGRIRIRANSIVQARRDDPPFVVEAQARAFDVAPGRNAIAIELPRRHQVVLVLRDGMRNVPLVDGAQITVESGGRPIEVARTCTREGHASLQGLGPGIHRFSVSGVPGFETASVEVEIRRRAREVVVVPLRRA